MKRMRRKDQFIDVIGVWDGTDGEVTDWLTANGYVFQVQVEDAEQINWRTKPRLGKETPEEEMEPRKQLSILGKRLYDEITLHPGSTLVLVEDSRVASYDKDVIDEQFEDL